MKYCSHCGKEIMDEAIMCPGCGCSVETQLKTAAQGYDAPSTGMAVLGFFIPIVGLIIYLVEKDKRPLGWREPSTVRFRSPLCSRGLVLITRRR